MMMPCVSWGQKGGEMKIEINGMSLAEWHYTLPDWGDLSYHEMLQRIPCDGSARLLEGPPAVVDHLRSTGNLAINFSSDKRVKCDLPIKGIGFFGP
jgi:hypothetical protein